jgi:hypothetical protein
MVTNYPQRLTATTDMAVPTETGLLARAFGRISQMMCGLGGHDSVLHFEGKRVMMRCTSCGHNSPGWDINERAPRRRFEGDARRHLLTPQRLTLRKSA